VFLTQASDLWTGAMSALSSGGVLAGVAGSALGVGEEGTLKSLDPRAAIDLLRQHGGALWRLLGGVATASASAVVGLVVFALTLYAFIVDGPAIHAWVARRSLIDAGARRRLLGAFRETGRGLIIGAGGTALAQSVVAAVAYASLGIRSAVALGVLTGVFAFVPAVGTAAVWVPVAAILAVTGHPQRAIVLALLGLGVIGTIDNLLRPWLARRGSLQLPATVVFLSIIGGLRLVGGWGVILGPLAVRLASEGLAIARERRIAGPRDVHHGIGRPPSGIDASGVTPT
jgi:predicted PurR-regulated permease PerM